MNSNSSSRSSVLNNQADRNVMQITPLQRAVSGMKCCGYADVLEITNSLT